MYKVIEYFTDLKDSNYAYGVGSVYPRAGYTPAPERIAELSGGGNKRGRPVIEEISETDENEIEEDITELLGDEHTTAKDEKAKRGRKKTNKE